MPEELSAESKLFFKEEIEKIRKDIREEVEEVKSKTTKTFTTVVIVVGLITGLGVYGIAKSYINTAVEAKLDKDTVATIEGYKNEASNLRDKIVGYEQEANSILASQSYKMLIGTIVPYGGKIESTTEDPCQVKPGWFFCNGASLDCKKYKELFDVIGWAFGKPNRDTFKLPDLRGRVTVGAGTGKGLTQRELGEKAGEEKHKLTIPEMPRHTHDWLKGTEGDDSGNGGSHGEYTLAPKPQNFVNPIDYTGGDKPHENMQPFLVVNYIIKAR